MVKGPFDEFKLEATFIIGIKNLLFSAELCRNLCLSNKAGNETSATANSLPARYVRLKFLQGNSILFRSDNYYAPGSYRQPPTSFLNFTTKKSAQDRRFVNSAHVALSNLSPKFTIPHAL